MTFTTTPPTTPGFYAWRLFPTDIPNPCWVTTDGETFWREGKYPATNGEWCRLVPAEEIEKAHEEGYWANNRDSLCHIAWANSRAKRVMEGGEVKVKQEAPAGSLERTGSAFVKMFQPRFADLVESGAKNQTVRPTPKRMPKPGDLISLREWIGKPYRSKQQIIKEATVTRVRRIEIWARSEIIALDGMRLGYDATLSFAKADGFADHWDMFQWFEEQHGADKFEGVVIYWQNT